MPVTRSIRWQPGPFETEGLRTIVVVAVLLLGCVWPLVASMIRRLRDIGASSWLWLAALAAFHVFDATFTSKYVPPLNPGLTMFGVAGAWLTFIALLLMPSDAPPPLDGLAGIAAERARLREIARAQRRQRPSGSEEVEPRTGCALPSSMQSAMTQFEAGLQFGRRHQA
eukprot:gene30029-33931_t